MDLTSLLEQGGKESETLYVVSVQVRNQDIDSFRIDECRTETPDTGTRIQDNRRPVCRTYFDTGSVSAIHNGFRAGTGQ